MPKFKYTVIYALELNQKMVGSFQKVLIEKESKKSNMHWAGRTDSNEWVIIEKNNSNIKDIVPFLYLFFG